MKMIFFMTFAFAVSTEKKLNPPFLEHVNFVIRRLKTMDQYIVLSNVRILLRLDNREIIGPNELYHTASAGDSLGFNFNT
jgi:hypothetical protein